MFLDDFFKLVFKSYTPINNVKIIVQYPLLIMLKISMSHRDTFNKKLVRILCNIIFNYLFTKYDHIKYLYLHILYYTNSR